MDTARDGPQETAGDPPRRLFVYTRGFLTDRRIRRILELSGYRITLGRPGPRDRIAVWGHSPYAGRGERAARRSGAALLRVEDAFLRSLFPGRAGEPPLGLVLDRSGMHYDARGPSDLERLLNEDPLDDPVLLRRAQSGMDRLQAAHLSKYSALRPDLPLPEPGYVLVVDQTRGDASIRLGGADADRFARMLAAARADHPDTRILIKSHPETQRGFRPGHFGPADEDRRTRLLDAPVSPWSLFAGARAVYTVSSQLGFEAIIAGHRPHVFGQPFYAGWGLSHDIYPPARRGRVLDAAQPFAGAMLLYPTWYDPFHDRLGRFEDALGALEAQTRAWREDAQGHVAAGMRLWKRQPLQRFFGRHRRLRFAEGPRAVSLARAEGRGLLVWAGKETPELSGAAARAELPLRRVEDGFLRSRGLGAELVPPLSLVTDDLGIYYDPSRPSRLERLLAGAAALSPAALDRAERLRSAVVDAGLSKYNLALDSTSERMAAKEARGRRRILVPGQVEDDASILRGAGAVRTNLGLLKEARRRNPDALITYKPHPDVEAGLRSGRVSPQDLAPLADRVATRADPAALIAETDEIWTMTSLLGFEALLRGKSVTCLGTPFYAGWGLTRDLAPPCPRRGTALSLAALVHGALIDYPRYLDPVSGLPCPPEIAVERLACGTIPRPGPVNRLTAKLQGAMASYAWLWR